MAKKKKGIKDVEIKQLGARIKELRELKGYSSQETFANDNDYTLSYFSRIERVEDIRFSSLLRICEALDIDLQTFFSKGVKKNP